MIRFESVTLAYRGAGAPAVRNFSFHVEAGRVTGLVGPNGSGKSTVVRSLLGWLSPSSGGITVGGTDLRALSRRDAAARMAVVPQREEPLFPVSVRDFVLLGRFAHASRWGALTAADHAACMRAAEQADVAALLDRRTDQLSGGEWQRVRVARALAQGGGALVLDEPNSYLDIAHEMALFELLDRVARSGVAVLLISHQLNLVARFAGHIALMDAGEIVAQGDPATVMRGDVLERVYRWPILVTRDAATGAPTLVPMRDRSPR
ncbi:MAG: ABC transporter ATP-binding protein [Gemmatimonadetes bacterium]|nr:ABC transporter ATP-binding protein [Gemmatimonadota bacterium]